MEHIETVTPLSVRVQDRRDAFIPRASDEFVLTDEIQRITERAVAYLEAGYPIHFTGMAGTGKTSLAFHVASLLSRPAVLIHGDDEHSRSDLVGGEVGYRKSRVVDNYIRSVLKTDEQVRTLWQDSRLAKACREGYTLIYDEFSRSRPEANNVLLSILEERILNLSHGTSEGYVRVHPKFRAIFTSNTEEYAGTHKTQSALLDRLITIELHYQSRETEVEIVRSRSGISQEGAERIVDIVRGVRNVDFGEYGPSVRKAIAMARVLATREDDISASNEFFRAVCEDILCPNRHSIHRPNGVDVRASIDAVIRRVLTHSYVSQL